MSNAWIRGRRCGVDNCRSKYYRTIDGQRVCQFGHVNESHIEINDEEDDMTSVTVTRRLTSQLSKKSSQGMRKRQSRFAHLKLYGDKGRDMAFKTLQYLLKEQTRFLIETKGLPDVLEPVVKRLWVGYLNNVAYQTRGYSSDRESLVSDSQTEESDASVGSSSGSSAFRTKWRVDVIVDLVAILYVACRKLSLPVYLNDFIKWIMLRELPFLKGSFVIPKKLYNRLGGIFLTMVNCRSPPSNRKLCKSVTIVLKANEIEGLSLNYHPFLWSSVTALFLPSTIYLATKKYIAMQGVGTEFLTGITEYRSRFPELNVLCSLIVVTKLYFLQGHYGFPAKIQKMEDWLSLVQESDDSQAETERGLYRQLYDIDNEENEGGILQWNDDMTNRYLDWFTEKVVKTQLPHQDDLTPINRRLMTIFELPQDSEQESEPLIESIKMGYAQMAMSQVDVTVGKSMKLSDLYKVEDVLIEHIMVHHSFERNRILTCLHRLENTMFSSYYRQ